MHGAKNAPGIVPQAINFIFQTIEATPERDFVLRCSYLEIYNECINDLLSPNGINLKLADDRKRGVRVIGALEEVCNSLDHVQSLLKVGEVNKHYASTAANLRSSRAHTVFRMIIDGKNRDGPKELTSSVVNLIDLSGSESANVHTPEDVKRAREMKYINKSLLNLGIVIMRLSEKNSEKTWIPYRDSKLTRILQSAMSGQSKISIICNISPAKSEETINTLRFAQRAKKIKQVLTKAVVLDKDAIILKYENEIFSLQEKLAELETKYSEDLTNRSPQESIELLYKIEELNSHLETKETLFREQESKFEAYEEEKLSLLSEIEKLKSFILDSESIKVRRESECEPLDLLVSDFDKLELNKNESLLCDNLDEIPKLLQDPDPLAKMKQNEEAELISQSLQTSPEK